MKKHNFLTVIISLFISILYYGFVTSKTIFLSTHFLKILDFNDYISILLKIIVSLWMIFITTIFLISFFIDLKDNNKKALASLSFLSILLVVCFNLNDWMIGLSEKNPHTNIQIIVGTAKVCTDYIVIWFGLYLIRKYRDSIGDILE